MKNLKNYLSFLTFTIGLGLLVTLIQEVGLKDIFDTFHQLGLNLVWIFLLPVTWYLLQSFAWYRVLRDDGSDVTLWQIFLLKITGEAVNTITPVSIMGGDPYRAFLLKKQIAGPDSVASVIIDRTMHTIAVFILLVITFGLAWRNVPLPGEWRVALPGVIVIFFIFLLALVGSQKKGLFQGITHVLQKAGIQKQRLEALHEKIKNLDDKISAFYAKNRMHFFEILTLHFISRTLGAVEIFMIARFLALPVTFTHCLYLTSLSILINIVFVFIPGSLGVMEGGYGALFYLLKLDPLYGIAIQLVRRVRTFFWIFLGLLAMLLYKPRKKAAITPTAGHSI